MTTLKLTLNEKTGKGKQLLAFIREMAISDNSIVVENIYEPNKETIKALEEAEAGFVTKVNSIDELFDSIV